jgi:hypothetical protein
MAEDLGLSVGSRFIILIENLGIRCVSLKFIAGLPRLNKKTERLNRLFATC